MKIIIECDDSHKDEITELLKELLVKDGVRININPSDFIEFEGDRIGAVDSEEMLNNYIEKFDLDAEEERGLRDAFKVKIKKLDDVAKVKGIGKMKIPTAKEMFSDYIEQHSQLLDDEERKLLEHAKENGFRN